MVLLNKQVSESEWPPLVARVPKETPGNLVRVRDPRVSAIDETYRIL